MVALELHKLMMNSLHAFLDGFPCSMTAAETSSVSDLRFLVRNGD